MVRSSGGSGKRKKSSSSPKRIQRYYEQSSGQIKDLSPRKIKRGSSLRKTDVFPTNNYFGVITHLPTKLVANFPTFEGDEQQWRGHPYGGRYQTESRGSRRWFNFVKSIHQRGVSNNIRIDQVDLRTSPFNRQKLERGFFHYGITDGNHRRFAAMEIGLKKVPVYLSWYGKRAPKFQDIANTFKFSVRHVKGV